MKLVGGGGDGSVKPVNSPQDRETAGSMQHIDAYKILGRNLVIASLANIKTHDLVPSG